MNRRGIQKEWSKNKRKSIKDRIYKAEENIYNTKKCLLVSCSFIRLYRILCAMFKRLYILAPLQQQPEWEREKKVPIWEWVNEVKKKEEMTGNIESM